MSAVLSSHCPLAYTPGLLQFKNISRDKYTELSTLDDQSNYLKGTVVNRALPS